MNGFMVSETVIDRASPKDFSEVKESGIAETDRPVLPKELDSFTASSAESEDSLHKVYERFNLIDSYPSEKTSVSKSNSQIERVDSRFQAKISDAKIFDKETGKTYESIEAWQKKQENLLKRYTGIAEHYQTKADKEWDSFVRVTSNGETENKRYEHYDSFREYQSKAREYKKMAKEIEISPDDYLLSGRLEVLVQNTPDSFRPEKSEYGEKTTVFSSLSDMKEALGKSYTELKEDKPPNSPNIAKWFDSGGTIRAERINGHSVWTYTDAESKSVQYVDGYIKFPPEAKHAVIDDISIGLFTGNRNEDKRIYLEKLEEEYALTDIPDGYALHHDTENGLLQLVKMDYHTEFTHAGGHSMFREAV